MENRTTSVLQYRSLSPQMSQMSADYKQQEIERDSSCDLTGICGFLALICVNLRHLRTHKNRWK
jgi:hypothetical protein